MFKIVFYVTESASAPARFNLLLKYANENTKTPLSIFKASEEVQAEAASFLRKADISTTLKCFDIKRKCAVSRIDPTNNDLAFAGADNISIYEVYYCFFDLLAGINHPDIDGELVFNFDNKIIESCRSQFNISVSSDENDKIIKTLQKFTKK